MSKRKPKGLDFSEMPEQYKYLWSWFVRISNSGEVSLLSIESFCRLMLIKLNPEEVNMILDWDLAYKKTMAEGVKPKNAPKLNKFKR